MYKYILGFILVVIGSCATKEIIVHNNTKRLDDIEKKVEIIDKLNSVRDSSEQAKEVAQSLINLDLYSKLKVLTSDNDALLNDFDREINNLKVNSDTLSSSVDDILSDVVNNTES